MAERALLLQHEPAGPPGSVRAWAEARGFEVEILMADEEWPIPDLGSVAFVCSLGSQHASYDDTVPWLGRELELLAKAHEADVPVLGICFGSQSLARSLGARTLLADAIEVGWYELDSSDDSPVSRGPWFFWHEDRFEVPRGARLLGSTATGPAAYTVGRSMAVQFHPEVTAEILEGWIRISHNEIPTAVLEQALQRTAAESDRAAERAWALYDAFLAGLARR